MVACSADLIFASRFSMVGSIGVVMTSFSCVGLMNMLGIESKVYTAGPRKAGVNPLTRTTEEEEMDLLTETHMEFMIFIYFFNWKMIPQGTHHPPQLENSN